MRGKSVFFFCCFWVSLWLRHLPRWQTRSGRRGLRQPALAQPHTQAHDGSSAPGFLSCHLVPHVLMFFPLAASSTSEMWQSVESVRWEMQPTSPRRYCRFVCRAISFMPPVGKAVRNFTNMAIYPCLAGCIPSNAIPSASQKAILIYSLLCVALNNDFMHFKVQRE